MTKREKAILMTAAALLLALAIVAAWQAAQVGQAEERLAQTRAELALQRTESSLALAAIEASRGSYELARQHASTFFTRLQGTVAGAPTNARPQLAQILQQRDAMITGLSRSDPQAGPQLVQLLMRYRLAFGESVGPQPQAPAPQPARPGSDSGR